VIVETKAVRNLTGAHEAQIPGYLKNTKFHLGLLINFGDKLESKRLIHSTDSRQRISHVDSTSKRHPRVSAPERNANGLLHKSCSRRNHT
jgi:hypothetical protein